MVPAQLLVTLSLALVCVEAGRSRGSLTTTTPAPPPLPGPLDLTLALERNATPFEPSFAITRNNSANGEFGWVSTQSWCSSGQAGTHIEAPFHLNERGWKVDELPMDRLLVSGVLLDVSRDVSANASQDASFVLTAEHLAAWEKKHGLPPNPSVLLVRFGFGSGGARRARNTTASTILPGLSQDAAVRLATQGRVVGVGVDLPALDPTAAPTPNPTPTTAAQRRGEPAARALMAANIYTLLNLDLRHDLPAKGFSLLVLPAKVRGASTAPTRVVATTRSPSPSKSSAWRTSPVTLAALLGVVGVVSRQSSQV